MIQLLPGKHYIFTGSEGNIEVEYLRSENYPDHPSKYLFGDIKTGETIDLFRSSVGSNIKEIAIDPNSGTKYDQSKLNWALLPLDQIEQVVKVLHYGAQKYSAGNWKNVQNGYERYLAASMRHLVADRQGELLDNDTKIYHLAHSICCQLFMLYLRMEENGKKDSGRTDGLKDNKSSTPSDKPTDKLF